MCVIYLFRQWRLEIQCRSYSEECDLIAPVIVIPNNKTTHNVLIQRSEIWVFFVTLCFATLGKGSVSSWYVYCNRATCGSRLVHLVDIQWSRAQVHVQMCSEFTALGNVQWKKIEFFFWSLFVPLSPLSVTLPSYGQNYFFFPSKNANPLEKNTLKNTVRLILNQVFLGPGFSKYPFKNLSDVPPFLFFRWDNQTFRTSLVIVSCMEEITVSWVSVLMWWTRSWMDWAGVFLSSATSCWSTHSLSSHLISTWYSNTLL